MSSIALPARSAGAAATLSGVALIGLGVVAAVDPTFVAAIWFVVAALAAWLLSAAVLGLRTAVGDVRGAPLALVIASAAFALFGLAHLYALVDEDTAVLLFSVFMIVAALGVVVAGIGVLRAGIWQGGRRFVPLLCGVWPIATIPAGAALGDLPHFLAIAVWGACWVALGLSLLSVAAGSRRPALDRAV